MKLRYLFAAALISALPVSAAHAGVFISIAPPALLTYEQPVCPTDGYLWTPGYWAYDNDGGQYYWVNGVWCPPPRVGFLWTPGYWGFNNGAYAFNEGYWGPTVGFYGGINYGFGYGGYGYYGGRWDGGVFRYNTAITRVNVRNIHNTYIDRSVVHNTTNSRASFNGRGGISAKPDAAQLAASHGQHVGATAAQTKAVKTAATTHAGTAKPGTPNKAPNTTAGHGTPKTNLVHNTPTTHHTPTTSHLSNPTHPNTHVGTTRTTGGARTNSRTAGISRTRSPQVTHTPQISHAPKPTRTAAPHPTGNTRKKN